MFMACSFCGVGAIPPRDSVTSIRVGLAPARIRYLSRRFQSPWKIANVVVGINVVNSVSESWTGIGGVAGFCATVFIRRWPHMKHGDAYSRITLLQIVQEVSTTANLPRQKPTAGCPPWRRDRRHLGISAQHTVERFAVVLRSQDEGDQMIAPRHTA